MDNSVMTLFPTGKFLHSLETERIPCTIFLMNGFQMHNVTLIEHDNISIIMEANGKQQMVFRQAISTIVPDCLVRMSSPTMSEGSSE